MIFKYVRFKIYRRRRLLWPFNRCVHSTEIVGQNKMVLVVGVKPLLDACCYCYCDRDYSIPFLATRQEKEKAIPKWTENMGRKVG